MNALVWFYIGCLAGITLYLLAAETPPLMRKVFRHWQSHNREVNADIAYLRSLPKGMEDEQ